MAKVPLRVYTREIETLIERGNTDEAIAHCRHILRTFPKYLEVYRLLGKANLESRRYTEAADVFKRILLAVPDDFVSHVGMSIIFDDQKKLDETIWHMERAFEVQPSNAAVQAELQRLYGQRDGREPHKIRLTRGALAHMYVQGELYAQAISEIRSVLAEDPSRNEMLVLLALANYRSGQKADASDVCSQLLSRFPYCLTANQILVELLPGTGMADSVSTYRNRVMELEPYAAYSPSSIFQFEEAPDNAVTIDRLEYTGQPVSEPMEWRGSLSSEVAPAPAVEPEWMRSSREEAAPLPSTPEAAPASQGEDIPDWMREHGWGQSTGNFDEQAFASSEASSDGIEKADLPDWIRTMAPSSEPAAPAAPAAETEEETDDWLNKLTAAASASAVAAGSGDWLSGQSEPAAQKPAESASSLPDWLSDLSSDKPAKPASAMPDWLDEPSPAATAPAASGLGDLGTSAAEQDAAMLWLESLAAKQGANAEELITDPNARLETPPEWVEQAREIGETPAAPAAPSSGLGDLGTSAAEQDAAMLWLESLAAKQGANAEELITDPNARLETPPEWVEQAREIGETPAAPAAPSSGLGDLGTSAAEQDAAMLWLESLAAKQGANAEELITDPNARLEKPPEWVEQAREIGEAQETAPAESLWPVADDTGVFERPSQPAMDETSVWLRKLEAEEEQTSSRASEQPEPSQMFQSEAVSAADATSAWLENLEKEEALPATEAPAVPANEAVVPSWLKNLEKESATPAPVAAPSVNDDLPSWLRDEPRQEENAPEPTRPADWVPEVKAAPAPKPPAPKPAKPAQTAKLSKPSVAPTPAPRAEAATPAPLAEKPAPSAPKPAPKKKEPRQPAPALERVKSSRGGILPPMTDIGLDQARDHLAHAKIPDALQAYGALIRKGKMLEDIIFDLKEALYRFPVEVSIWQALGDAYMRANRLQDALDAYTKAEELLR